MTINQAAIAYVQHQITWNEYLQITKQLSLSVYLAGKVNLSQLKTACQSWDNTLRG